MIYTIPVDSTFPSFVQETTLDGVTYRLLFRWNSRDLYWYLTVRTLEDVEIVPSRRLVPGARFLRYVSAAVRPAGELVVLEEPSRTNLGKTAQLVYLDEDSVTEIEAAA